MPRPKLGHTFECLSCGQIVYRSLGDQRKAPRKRFYCSKTCRRTLAPKPRARSILANAIKRGCVVRPCRCARCLLACTPQGHHSDYSKPLDVEWLCQGCHDKESYAARKAVTDSRRKWFGLCACGRSEKKTRGMCVLCYARWRNGSMTGTCRVPGCMAQPYARGLCGTHRQNHSLRLTFGLPPSKRGPKPNGQVAQKPYR